MTDDGSIPDDELDRMLSVSGPHPDVDDGTWGWTPGRVVASLLVVAMVVFWVWAFSPLAPRGHPDQLDDPTFAELAETRCARAIARIDAEVPAAFDAADPEERASQIEAATDIIEAMTADLAATAPDPDTRDGDLVRRWLADWAIYIGDRNAYAADFRAGIDAAFSVSVVRDGQVTDPIDSFANANQMPSCASPTDV